MKILIFWDVALCRLASSFRYFDEGKACLQNVGICLPDETSLYPCRLKFKSSLAPL
jgi:hypothetical protein